MRIIQFCPIFNESQILDLHLDEFSIYGTKLHAIETNRTFMGDKKTVLFSDKKHDHLSTEIVDASKIFRYGLFDRLVGVSNKDFNMPTQILNRFNRIQFNWFNEAAQRNYCTNFQNDITDDDIIILSDIDEIIDSRHIHEIIDQTKRRGIITIKLHFTLFFLNLFSVNWGGPPQYSYRMFIMTGKCFKTMKLTPDQLRKMGEAGKLYNEVFCLEQPMGFHHSWLGNEEFILTKIKSYAHKEHRKYANIDYIKNRIKNNLSIFPGHELKKDNSIILLSAIEKDWDKYKIFIV
jgi:hypothetical protein